MSSRNRLPERSPRTVTCPECGRTWACDPSATVFVGMHTMMPNGPVCPFAGEVKTYKIKKLGGLLDGN